MSEFQQQHPLSPKKFWKKMLTGVASSSRPGRRSGGFFSLLIFLFIVGPSLSQAFGWSADGASTYIHWALIALGLWVIYLLLKAWYVTAYIRSYFYDVGPDAVTIRKGVFTPQEIHVLWSKVQDVYVDQDFLDRLLGLYDVHLASATAASGMEAHIDGVEKEVAESLKEYLFSRITTYNQPASAASSMAPISSMQSAPTSAPVPQGISSENYPIVGRWLVTQAFGYIVLFIFLSFIIGLVALSIAGAADSTASVGVMWMAIGAAILLSAFLSCIGFIFRILWRKTFSFEFGPEYITKREGVISRSEKHVPYRTVQDVIVGQGLIERMLGIATVTIQNAAQGGMFAGNISIPGQPLAKANELSTAIRQIVHSANPGSTGL